MFCFHQNRNTSISAFFGKITYRLVRRKVIKLTPRWVWIFHRYVAWRSVCWKQHTFNITHQIIVFSMNWNKNQEKQCSAITSLFEFQEKLCITYRSKWTHKKRIAVSFRMNNNPMKLVWLFEMSIFLEQLLAFRIYLMCAFAFIPLNQRLYQEKTFDKLSFDFPA